MQRFPKTIQAMLPQEEAQRDMIGMSASSVLLFADRVLKIGRDCEEERREVQIMRWLRGRLPVPEILCHEVEDGKIFLLMSRMEGAMLCDEACMADPKNLAVLAASGLKMLWEVDAAACPVDARLDVKLAMARYNINHGLVNLDNAEPETFGPGGFRDPEDLLGYLEANRPDEDAVFSHGDFSLPNIFAQGGGISGFIDLGRAGTAGRYQDIALCYRSLLHNYDGTYSGTPREGFSPEMLFDALGLQPDWEKIRYYILLDELF